MCAGETLTEQRKTSIRCAQRTIGCYRTNHVGSVPSLLFLCECVDKGPVFVSLHGNKLVNIAVGDMAPKQPTWAIKRF